jgi:hypothetical protein
MIAVRARMLLHLLIHASLIVRPIPSFKVERNGPSGEFSWACFGETELQVC